jgi:hypothetical protein
MRLLLLTALAGAALASGASAATATADQLRNSATICLDPGGIKHAAICRSMNATRFANKPDICHCEGPLRQVQTPWCAPGETPLPESRAVERARLKAVKDGNLFGATYQGKPFCEPVPQGGR